MTPRLQLHLLPHNPRETPRPPIPGPRLDHIFDRLLVYELRVHPRVVERRREMRHRAYRGLIASLT